MTATQASEREERWTIFLRNGVTMGVERGEEGCVVGEPDQEIEVIPATLLTEALEVMESAADSVRLGLPSASTLETVDALDDAASRLRAKLSDTKEAG